MHQTSPQSFDEHVVWADSAPVHPTSSSKMWPVPFPNLSELMVAIAMPQPSCWHTTKTSFISHSSSRMVPYCPSWKTSTVRCSCLDCSQAGFQLSLGVRKSNCIQWISMWDKENELGRVHDFLFLFLHFSSQYLCTLHQQLYSGHNFIFYGFFCRALLQTDLITHAVHWIHSGGTWSFPKLSSTWAAKAVPQPSTRHTTSVSAKSQPLLHTVPHWWLWSTSTLPVQGVGPPVSLKDSERERGGS